MAQVYKKQEMNLFFPEKISYPGLKTQNFTPTLPNKSAILN